MNLHFEKTDFSFGKYWFNRTYEEYEKKLERTVLYDRLYNWRKTKFILG